ncbi:hypothetical protein HAX54_027934, partial [Datura stramonium]|nr:hypothetical protein [Datura stramonium]
SHEVIIQQLERRMSNWHSNGGSITANNITPRKDIMDDNVLEWEMEEEAIEELIVDVFLKANEIHHVHKE